MSPHAPHPDDDAADDMADDLTLSPAEGPTDEATRAAPTRAAPTRVAPTRAVRAGVARGSDAVVDVVVVGGGIAGSAAAFALARTGRTVRVLERAPSFAETGAGLQLAPNATRILRRWGLLDEITRRGVQPRRWVLRDARDGTELTHLDLRDVEHRYGAPYLTISRHALHTVLLDACRAAGVDLVSDTAVTGAHPIATDRGQTAVTSSRRLDRGQLVVAADGIWSRLRRTISTDVPRYHGVAAYRGVTPTADLNHPPRPHTPTTTAPGATGQDIAGLGCTWSALDEIVLHIGPGRHLVQYPLDRGRTYNQVAVCPSHTPDGEPSDLHDAFADDSPDVRRTLCYVNPARCWPVADRDPITTWTSTGTRRVVLIGDAAHPMLPYFAQGACQAIEDADTLAAQITAHPHDWDQALHAYSTHRVPRVSDIQRRVRTWGQLLHADGLLRETRNALFRDRNPTDYRHLDWLWQHQP